MLIGVTIIHNPDDSSAQLIATGVDMTTPPGAAVVATLLRNMGAQVEKSIARMQVIEEMRAQQETPPVEEELDAI